ncbi:TraB/GumN family protein [Marinomonas sp.]
MNKLSLLMIITCLASFTALANSASVWKVSSGEHTLYLGGTLHLLAQEDYPLPSEYEQAYQAADTIFFETDMSVLNSAQFQQKIGQIFRSDIPLSQQLSPGTYQKLLEYFTQKNINPMTFQYYKAALVSVSISMFELESMGFNTTGVDNYYHQQAMLDNKKVQWLESPQSQLETLASLGDEDPDKLILYTLFDIEAMPESLGAVHSAWREGNMERLADYTLVDLKKDFRQIHQGLYVTRNQNWLPQILKMLKDDKTEFILVGVSHMAGEDGLLKQLAQQGYQIEQLSELTAQ